MFDKGNIINSFLPFLRKSKSNCIALQKRANDTKRILVGHANATQQFFFQDILIFMIKNSNGCNTLSSIVAKRPAPFFYQVFPAIIFKELCKQANTVLAAGNGVLFIKNPPKEDDKKEQDKEDTEQK